LAVILIFVFQYTGCAGQKIKMQLPKKWKCNNCFVTCWRNPLACQI